MKEEKEILEILENARPTLSASSRDALWEKIYSQVESVPIVSPYYSMFVMYKKYVAVCLVVLLVVSGGGTAYAGNQARPGERLFVIDKVLEQAELTLTPTQTLKEKARVRHGEERLLELRQIIANSSAQGGDVPQLEEMVGEILRYVDDGDFDDKKKGDFIERIAKEVRSERHIQSEVSKIQLRDGTAGIQIEERKNGERRIMVQDGERRIRMDEKDGEVKIKVREQKKSNKVDDIREEEDDSDRREDRSTDDKEQKNDDRGGSGNSNDDNDSDDDKSDDNDNDDDDTDDRFWDDDDKEEDGD